jgi:hypothetical protein
VGQFQVRNHFLELIHRLAVVIHIIVPIDGVLSQRWESVLMLCVRGLGEPPRGSLPTAKGCSAVFPLNRGVEEEGTTVVIIRVPRYDLSGFPAPQR